jgi:hypothetical protein
LEKLFRIIFIFLISDGARLAEIIDVPLLFAAVAYDLAHHEEGLQDEIASLVVVRVLE